MLVIVNLFFIVFDLQSDAYSTSLLQATGEQVSPLLPFLALSIWVVKLNHQDLSINLSTGTLKLQKKQKPFQTYDHTNIFSVVLQTWFTNDLNLLD